MLKSSTLARARKLKSHWRQACFATGLEAGATSLLQIVSASNIIRVVAIPVRVEVQRSAGHLVSDSIGAVVEFVAVSGI